MSAWLKKFMPVEVLPLVGAVTVGCCLSVYAMHHHLFHNADINPKVGGTRYSWERFDAADVKTPHFGFLEGARANERKEAAAVRHVSEYHKD